MSTSKCTASKCSSSARDREVFRYYIPPTIRNPGSEGEEPTRKKASSDPTLTAFAQLGCLRINCKRGIITLSTRGTEYVLAEATRELSLQRDDDESDNLWHGEGAILRHTGFGAELTRVFEQSDAPAIFLCGDLGGDEKFKDQPTVAGPPYLKAIACAPLISPEHNVVVGKYIVVDDEPREKLNEEEQQFLLDMAVTVMDYLESGRVKRQQYRAERMIKAIGLFIEGKSTLREWWLETGHKYQHAALRKRSIIDNTPLDKQADAEFGVQEETDYFSRNALDGLAGQALRSPSMHQSPSSVSLSTVDRGDRELGDGRPPIPRDDTTSSDRTRTSAPLSAPLARPPMLRENTLGSWADTSTVPSTRLSRSWRDRNSSVTTFDDNATDLTPDSEKHNSVSFDLPSNHLLSDVSQDQQNDVLSSDVKDVFARASNLIREAIGVEGVIYYDASVGSFGGSSKKEVVQEVAPDAFYADQLLEDPSYTSEDDPIRQSPGTDGEVKNISSPKEGAENFCDILGFSTRRRSSLKGHDFYDEQKQMPESILRKLLKRYPHGKVFNFDRDGTYSSSDSDHNHASNLKDTQRSFDAGKHLSRNCLRRKRISIDQEAAAILKVLPGARSVFWFPLWDSSRERWFSGSFIWSTSDTRTLCPIEDITYLAAFGNSTMAEISRLSAQVLSKMKTDFISSISHELRSPLHGVLASVEFLQETSMTEIQADMVSNISASGKVLLDTINHVLDFSKVNRKIKNRKRLPKKRSKESGRRENMDDGGEEKADICILSEEVIESIYTGQGVSKKALGLAGHRRQVSTGSTEPAVTVIVDVRWRSNWTFEIDAGAWRRILMNLFSNAMKYTKAGFVNICLEIEEDVASHSKKSRSNVVLKIRDSGKGISQEFLKHQLYKPFTQEDSLATGAGLGLSIVKAIIQDLGGRIKFASEAGTGTEVTVRIPLTERLPKPGNLRVVSEIRAAMQGMKFRLEGFDRYPDITETPTGILSSDSEAAMMLKSTVQDTLVDWYGMEALAASGSESSEADVVVFMEAGSDQTLEQILQNHHDSHPKNAGKSVAIVLTSSYHSGPKVDAHQHFRIFYLQQPFGPHKIGKILHQAFCTASYGQHLEASRISPQNSQKPSIDLAPGLSSMSPTSVALDFAVRTLLEEVPDQIHGHPAVVSGNPVANKPKDVRLQEPVKTPGQASANGKMLAEKEKGGLRVLLVEDNEINLKLLIATMRKLKLEHATAINGLEALNSYKDCDGAFDVIFMAMKALRGMLDDLKREGRAAFAG
ncbi:hsp90-like protein [Diplocarpon rosae]|nr:hsp90-like protein [Diplocarpon rosae]